MIVSGRRILVCAALTGAVATLWAAMAERRQRHAEGLLEKSLEDSYPASDPPASQDFDIPINRR